MKKAVAIILFCVCHWGNFLAAQSIFGKVTDTEGNPIAGAYCVLMNLPDSSNVNWTATDSEGRFSFSLHEDREYLLHFSSLGYNDTYRKCRAGDLGNIVLSILNLGEITVESQMKSHDAITESFFLTDSLRNLSTNSLRLLEKLDGISVDWMSDAVKIGDHRDVPILLNGREVGKDLVLNLNPKRVKKIELLRYPKGKYGDMPIVLNIITFDSYLGYDIGLQSKAMVSLRRPASHAEDIGANLVYTFNKWNIYSDIGLTYKDSYEASSYSYTYKGNIAEETAKEDFRNPNGNSRDAKLKASIGADYKISPGHTLSLQSWIDGGIYSRHENYMTPGNGILSENSNRYRNINSTNGIFYSGEITERFIITSELTYNYYNINENRQYRDTADVSDKYYSGRKDYWRYNINANNTWNRILGSNIGYTYTDKRYTNRDSRSGEKLFSSSEGRHDIYAYLKIDPHPKVSLAIGSNVLFVNRDNGTDSDSRSSWMPSAKLFWEPLKRLSISANYFCDIAYPNLDQLSTVSYNRNRILIYRGNPELRERVMHYMEWKIRIPKIIELTYMLKHSANDITPWYFMENSHVVETLTGSKYLHQYIGASGDYDIGQKFNINFTASYQWYGRRGPETGWKRGRTWYMDLMASYHLNRYLNLMASYFIRHDRMPLLQGEEYGQQESLLLGAMSSLCKGKLSLAMTFAIPTCLLKKRTYRNISIPGFGFTSWKDDRVNNALVQISLRYNIGKGNASRSENRNRSETEK